MKRILLACDLDNTLIHSHRHAAPGDVCVELLDGARQSFMSPRAYAALQALAPQLTLLPVTTRSIAQYARIEWPQGCAPRLAVTTNGAVLLEDGLPRQSWREGMLRAAEACRDEMLRIAPDFPAPEKCRLCRIVDEAYLYVHCHNEQDARAVEAQYAGATGLVCAATGRKVYFFPPEISKGAALRRMRAELEPDLCICAGDSAIDASMLSEADVALIPRDFDAAVACRDVRRCGADENFAEFILRTAAQLLEHGR